MDNDKPGSEPAPSRAEPARSMPKATAFTTGKAQDVGIGDAPPTATTLGAAPSTPSVDAGERNGVFARLVTNDNDIAGLVAYSIYKQNKLDWLTSFEKLKGRAPNDDELASYIIGEGTARRIATYRHLAEATLAGNGPDVGGAGAKGAAGRRGGPGFADRRALTTRLIATYALIAVLFFVGFLLAAHYTMTSR